MIDELPRILIVDDYAPVGRVLELLLIAKGYVCKCCRDTAAALPLLETFDPSGVIIDLGIPPMVGHCLARAIRASEDSGRYVLIAVSRAGPDEDRRSSREAGLDAFFVLPDELWAMMAGLENLMAQKGPTRAPRACGPQARPPIARHACVLSE